MINCCVLSSGDEEDILHRNYPPSPSSSLTQTKGTHGYSQLEWPFRCSYRTSLYRYMTSFLYFEDSSGLLRHTRKINKIQGRGMSWRQLFKPRNLDSFFFNLFFSTKSQEIPIIAFLLRIKWGDCYRLHTCNPILNMQPQPEALILINDKSLVGNQKITSIVSLGRQCKIGCFNKAVII